MNLKIKIEPNGKLPTKGTDGSAGMDCYADLSGFVSGGNVIVAEKDGKKTIYINPGQTVIVPLGFRVEFSPEWWLAVFSRSGLAAKKQIANLNGTGVIDSDYRGIVGAILHNHSHTPYAVMHGDRVSQIMVQKSEPIDFDMVGEFQGTNRGGGYGSTGN